MCGLVGVASKVLTEPAKKAFYDMLYLDVLRGEDSTGVATISNAFGDKPEAKIFKSLGSTSDFFYNHTTGRNRDLVVGPVSVLLGHNRFATQGKITEETAHPFDFPNLIGAHNGTVQQSSLKAFHGFDDYDIDSQIIYSHLSHTRSIDDVWKDADGALALTWWDKENNNLNIIRNAQRPMHMAYTEDGKTMFYASEMWMMLVAANRQGVKLQETFEAAPNRLYTFSMEEGERMVHVERDLPPFVVKPFYQHRYHHSRWDGLEDWDDWSLSGYKQTQKVVPKVMGPPDPVELVIREVHNNPAMPAAFANTANGELVRINIALTDLKVAKDKITGRGMGNGYYTTKRLQRSSLNPKEFYCSWGDLTYIKLKGQGHILRKEEHGFEIVYDTSSPSYAPWYEPNRVLTYEAYETKTACGCANCLKPPLWLERSKLTWLDKEMFICDTCRDIPFVQDLILEHKHNMKVA